MHQIRVASRRLRIALPLLARRPERKIVRRLRRRLRELIRAAGASRDLDVCVELFEEQLRGSGPLDAEVMVLRRRLVAARGKSRRRMAEDLIDLDLAGLRRDVKKVVGEPPEEIFIAVSRFRRSRDGLGARTLADVRDVGDRFEPVRLHALRRRVRRLRYVAEVGAVFREEASGAPKIFKGIQESLGRVHDAHVLAVRLERHAGTAARLGQDRIASAGRDLAARFMDLSRELHHAFVAADPLERIERALALMGRSVTAA